MHGRAYKVVLPLMSTIVPKRNAPFGMGVPTVCSASFVVLRE